MSGIIQGLLASFGGAITDAYFNLVTLLLPGNGTNGAQNNTFLDSSSNNFTITRNGNTTQGTFSPFSQTGWSNFFDGTDDYLAVADNAVLRPGTSNFTLEAWIWRNASGAAHTIYAKGGASTGIVFQVTSTNVLRFTHTTTNIDSIGTIAANIWTHVAVVREGTGTNQTKLYINGSQDGQGTVSTDFTQTEEVRIGTDRGATADFNGYISNLRFVKGTALYTTTFTPSTTPLTTTSQGATATEVELLTCQSNRFLDNSSNEFAITLTGTPSIQAFSPFAPTAAYSAATVGGSGYFDGSGDYLSVPASSQFLPGANTDFTFEAWVYLTAAPSAQGAIVVGTGEYGVNSDWSIAINSSRQPSFFFNVAPTGFSITSSTAVDLNSWNHIAVTRSGTGSNNLKMFLNGVNVAQASRNDTMDYTGNNLSIGADENGDESVLTGYISGLRLINGTGYTSISVPTAPPTNITNTVLLLNFTNAGITDATAKNDLETVGNAQISTTQSKFGGSSIYFDGTGDYLISNPATTDLYAFGSGDFTIEMWLRLNSVTGTQVFYDQRPLAGGVYPTLYMSGSTLFYYANGANRITGATLSTGQWYHIAVSRSGTSTKLFVDGAQSGSTYTDTNVYLNASLRPFIGGDGTNLGSNGLNGYIDDLRITKGYARYTANFTAPTAAFPLQ